MAWMFANKSKMAKKWASHTKNMKKLPKRKKPFKKNYSYEAIRIAKGG